MKNIIRFNFCTSCIEFDQEVSFAAKNRVTVSMDVIQRLRQEIPALPKKLAMAARYAVDQPERIALNSMRSSAKSVGVTSTTMLRLARQLGYDSYEDFRASFQTQLVSTGFGFRASALHDRGHDPEAGSLPEQFLGSSQKNLQVCQRSQGSCERRQNACWSDRVRPMSWRAL